METDALTANWETGEKTVSERFFQAKSYFPGALNMFPSRISNKTLKNVSKILPKKNLPYS